MKFKNRLEAGILLADKLKKYAREKNTCKTRR